MSYKFNPLQHGFQTLDEFPEQLENFNPKKTTIKIVEVGGDEFKPEDRIVYWYLACIESMEGDDRIKIVGGSYCSIRTEEDRKKRYNNFKKPENEKRYVSPEYKTEFFGCITNDNFAKELLLSLLGTTTNDGVEKYSLERYKRTLTIKRNK